MQTDHAFTIGRSHKVCEDYALSSGEAYKPYALISDGCSGSDRTDVGARLLLLEAENFIVDIGEPTEKEELHQIVCAAAAHWRLLGSHDCRYDMSMLDATLLGVMMAHRRPYAFGCGDGVIAFKKKDGRFVFYEIEAPSGYPIYPSYLLDHRRLQNVCNKGGTVVREYYETIDGEILVDDDYRKIEGVGLFGITESMDFPGEWELGHRGEPYKMESMAVFSDGVKSFVDQDRQCVPWLDVVREMMAFKGYKGEFVKRRMQGFLRACAKRGWQHDDDLSMAAVHIG